LDFIGSVGRKTFAIGQADLDRNPPVKELAEQKIKALLKEGVDLQGTEVIKISYPIQQVFPMFYGDEPCGEISKERLTELHLDLWS
jgi:hypothetical protein